MTTNQKSNQSFEGQNKQGCISTIIYPQINNPNTSSGNYHNKHSVGQQDSTNKDIQDQKDRDTCAQHQTTHQGCPTTCQTQRRHYNTWPNQQIVPIQETFPNQSQVPPHQTQPPQVMVLGQGLNLQGICINSKCRAYYQSVVNRKGYGDFNMTKENYHTKCPECCNFLNCIDMVYLVNGRCRLLGRIKGHHKEINREYFHNQLSKTDCEKWNIQTQVAGEIWEYLELIVERIHTDLVYL